MSTVNVAVWTTIWMIIALLLYKLIVNPQIVVPSSLKNASTCPDLWTFRSNMCYPEYDTKCIPFDPTKILNMKEACHIAKSCGTDWSGFCL